MNGSGSDEKVVFADSFHPQRRSRPVQLATQCDGSAVRAPAHEHPLRRTFKPCESLGQTARPLTPRPRGSCSRKLSAGGRAPMRPASFSTNRKSTTRLAPRASLDRLECRPKLRFLQPCASIPLELDRKALRRDALLRRPLLLLQHFPRIRGGDRQVFDSKLDC